MTLDFEDEPEAIIMDMIAFHCEFNREVPYWVDCEWVFGSLFLNRITFYLHNYVDVHFKIGIVMNHLILLMPL